jgi:hypothetical protein
MKTSPTAPRHEAFEHFSKHALRGRMPKFDGDLYTRIGLLESQA